MASAPAFTPRNPAYEQAVRSSFARQPAMGLIGATIESITPGLVRIVLPYRPDLTQQHGYFHGGITSAIADSAAGYAAYTLFPPQTAVLTVEFKINFVAPAQGERLVATGRVKKAGRMLTVVEFEVESLNTGAINACAYGLSTLMCLPETTTRTG